MWSSKGRGVGKGEEVKKRDQKEGRVTIKQLSEANVNWFAELNEANQLQKEACSGPDNRQWEPILDNMTIFNFQKLKMTWLDLKMQHLTEKILTSSLLEIHLSVNLK